MSDADASAGLPAALEAAAVANAVTVYASVTIACDALGRELSESEHRVALAAVVRAVLPLGLAHERERHAALVAGAEEVIKRWVGGSKGERLQAAIDQLADGLIRTRSPEGTPNTGATQ